MPRPLPLSYTTSGQVDPTNGRDGHQRDQLVPLNSSNAVDLSTGQTNVGLGNFVISPLASRLSTTYMNTPFQISFLPASYGGDSSVAMDKPVVARPVCSTAWSTVLELDGHGDLQPCPKRLDQSGKHGRHGQFQLCRHHAATGPLDLKQRYDHCARPGDAALKSRLPNQAPSPCS